MRTKMLLLANMTWLKLMINPCDYTFLNVYYADLNQNIQTFDHLSKKINHQSSESTNDDDDDSATALKIEKDNVIIHYYQ